MADARGGEEVSFTNAWALDEELLAEGDRKAEGLTFDDHGSPLVALDVKDRVTNGFPSGTPRARQRVTRAPRRFAARLSLHRSQAPHCSPFEPDISRVSTRMCARGCQ
jgi:hypothetical protein